MAPLLSTAAVAVALLACTAPITGQDFRGELLTTARYFAFRPVVQDTLDPGQVTERDGRFFFEGQRVSCRAGRCFAWRPADVQDGVALTQDLRLTGWGFGVQGLSATVLLRSRLGVGGGGFVWPRSDDHFDAVLAYAELAREVVRVRLGRQRTLSGLGFAGFDGLSVRVRPLEGVRLEAYGGRSLARGISEPRHEALQGLEDFLLDRNAYLLGGMAQAEPFPGTVLTARYQREIWSDRSGLLSERASLDLGTSLLHPVRLNASLDWDVAFGRVGKAHVQAQLPVPEADLLVEATLRRYVPYFELWTVWGFFDPTGHDEGSLRVTWSPRPRLRLWGSAGLRRYRDTGTDIVFGPVRDDTRRFAVGGGWRPGGGAWSLEGEYRLENGFGAFLSSGQLRAQYTASPDITLTARATAFQQIEEFRVGEGAVVGGGLGARLTLSDRIDVRGGLHLYRQMWEDRPSAVDWNQLRAFSAVRVALGDDPGPEAGRRP